MDYGFDDVQELLRASVKEFLQKEAPLRHVREMEEDARGFSPDLWQKMGQANWLGVDYPEQYGGLGGSFLSVAVIAEEMGKALFPSPYLATTVLAGHAILMAGDDKQKSELLPRITSGEIIVTLALTEPSATYDASGIETTAVAGRDGGYVLNGTKLLVPYAHVADRMVVVARTSSEGPAEAGISLFIVDPRSPGVSITPMRVISLEKQSEVALQDVRVPAAGLLGSAGNGWQVIERVLDKGKAAMSAEMVGGAQAALDLAVEYSKQRTQFGGPTGRFQAIKHPLSDLATETEGARLLIYEAVCGIAEGKPDAAAISMAKAFIGDVYVKTTRFAVQAHGGYGYMKEHDIQLYFRRAKAAEVILGDPISSRELAAQKLGL